MIVGVDPGPSTSHVVKMLEYGTLSTIGQRGAIQNEVLCQLLRDCHFGSPVLAIEMVESFGKPVGAEVFETVYWIGRFVEAHKGTSCRIPRGDVKMHLCGDRRVNDSAIRQRLIDIYGPGKEAAVGRKATPGPLYGVTGDMWQALAVARTYYDRRQHGETRNAAGMGSIR